MDSTFEPETWRKTIARTTHLGHANHLCNLTEMGTDIDAYKTLVRNGRFICKKCGRVAKAEKNLCEPILL